MKKLHRRLLAVGLLAMIMIFVALFSWRYQTLNAPLAHPAVKTRSLSLPAKVVLHRRTVSLEKSGSNYRTRSVACPASF
ncbi:hypothetical protein Lpp126_03714 [Lacticaseibacillus paracasei subsp. paracasei Lpp126]|uniref:Uncharacterized protein n=1 Tax=Lacticaseibacillus paracasei subsp. paracasei Lpp126 TaxID=1256206 RepID=S2S5J9_LACPA|nr:hypothetical protein Lpp126_03714 [Lacticaseibacillus paracasei subsp. paracasei Lpp126]